MTIIVTHAIFMKMIIIVVVVPLGQRFVGSNWNSVEAMGF
jgi:hypothetical protein